MDSTFAVKDAETESDLVYALRQRIKDLEEALGAEWRAPKCLKLSPTQTRVLGMIVKAESYARPSAIYTVLYGTSEDPPDDHIVAVFIAQIRRRLRDYGVTINNIHSVGYEITAENRAKLVALYDEAEHKLYARTAA